MASQSLYRKWRSQTFSDLVGQEAIVRTLKNALKNGNVAHAYLFTGPRGTGKTSTARLLAKTINCLHPRDGEPCNQCQQCREITAGNSFNVIEIDAASNRGIDSIRELREKVMMPPSTGKYKVYILDEAHMLTTEAFNALLKTLEEPPPHAVFVMATTDVHKMLPTVLSRCQRFDFKRFTMRQIVERLNFVADQEHIELDRGAAELIARAASGGMRDALSLLDQAIAYSGQRVSLPQVQAMLGVADPRAIQKLLLSVTQLDSPAGLHLIHELAEAGADLRQVNTQVAEYWRALMLAKAGADITEIMDYTEDETREVMHMLPFFTLEELAECARIFAQNELLQKSQGTPQLGLELALLTAIELHRQTQSSEGHTPPSTSAAPVARQTPMTRASETKPAHPLAHQADNHEVIDASASSMKSLTRIPEAASLPSTETSEQAKPSEAAAKLPDWEEIPAREEEFQDEANEGTLASIASSGDTGIAERPSGASPERGVGELKKEPFLAERPSGASPERGVGELKKEPPLVVDSFLTEVSPPSLPSTPEPMPTETDVPALTVEQIKEKWERVKRRIKTKKDGAMIAALLMDYAIVGVEGTAALPTIVLQATADFHYKSLQKSEERIKVIEWAMKVELGQECRIRLLAPGASFSAPTRVPPTSSRDSSVRSSHTTMLASPQQSAFIERAERDTTSRQSSLPASRSQGSEKLERKSEASTTSDSPPLEDAPLARMSDMRENSNEGKTALEGAVPGGAIEGTVHETRQHVLKQKASRDPVVQEVVRIFKADIKDVTPK